MSRRSSAPAILRDGPDPQEIQAKAMAAGLYAANMPAEVGARASIR
jgi:hypothetical protein